MRALNYKRRKASLPRPAQIAGWAPPQPAAPLVQRIEVARRFPGVASDPQNVPSLQVDLHPYGENDVIDGRD